MVITWIFRHLIMSSTCAVLLLGYMGVLDVGATASSIVRDAQTYVAGDQPLDPGGATERLLQRKHRALMDAAEETGAPTHQQGYYDALKQATAAE